MKKRVISTEYKHSDPEFIRHSDEMQDIITAVPSRLIRWGMFLFFCVFVMIICLAAFIHIPEMIDTTVQIKSKSFAKILIPPAASGKVHPGQVVLIDLKNYQLGVNEVVKGKIVHISDTVDNDGKLTADFSIDTVSSVKQALRLKLGMHVYARIKTQEVSILRRLCPNFFSNNENLSRN